MPKLAKLLLAVVLILTACGGEDTPPAAEETPEEATETESTEEAEPTPEETEEEPEPEPEPEPEDSSADPVEVGLQFVTALNGTTVAEYEQMLDLVSPGSPADAYAQVQVNNARATRADGFELPGESVNREGDVIVSDDGGAGIEFTDFQLDADGLLESFVVGGEPIAPLLSVGQQAVEVAPGATVKIVGAYRSVEYGGVVVALEVQAGDTDLESYLFSAEYVTADGQQRTAETASGPISLRPGSRANTLVAIPESDLGGTFYLEGSTGDDFEPWEFQADLPVSFG